MRVFQEFHKLQNMFCVNICLAYVRCAVVYVADGREQTVVLILLFAHLFYCLVAKTKTDAESVDYKQIV
jgi:hypothetical protein